MINKANTNNSYRLGRAAAIMQSLANTPQRVMGSIAAQPITMVSHWLPEAIAHDKNHELAEVMSRLKEIPFILNDYEHGQFILGYEAQICAMATRKSIGAKIRSEREAKGITVIELATLTGLDAITIDKIESGAWIESTNGHIKVCDALSLKMFID